MWQTFPLFGSTLLLCVMVVASYTFGVAVAAGATGRPRTLQAARFGAYGTVVLIASCVLCLAYAFLSHDFRLRYVAHYSDRSMPIGFLLTALWGGQDGSLLWWLFLLSIYIGVCIFSLGKKHLALQPYIIATMMGVVLFFCVLMAFAANPFSTGIGGARGDGEGLNPLLQNFYMIIHPPSLYVGFVGCTIPFAFAVAALVTGRLDTEWIVAARKFTLFSWLFLGIGNTLGMLWAYEELGWGGYWAWDPVENAAFLPFLTSSAFVHSVMIQERRGMLKLWNVSLVSLTFFMTIFGTFLTRSGAIASVHSFAQSSIGTYFVYFLVLVVAVVLTLILYRWPELRSLPPTPRLRKAALITGWAMLGIAAPGAWALSHFLPWPVLTIPLLLGGVVYTGVEIVFRRMTMGLDTESERPEIESIFSREFTFVMNNWALLGFMVFVLVATTFPMISEAFWNEKVTVGPPYYNAWVQPIGLVIFFLMGAGSLFGWKKTSNDALKKNFMAPTIAFVVAIALHFAIGARLGFPAIVFSDPIYPGTLGQVLRAFNAVTPVLGFSLCVFNAAVIVQEFVLLFRARKKSRASEGTPAWLWYAGFFPGFLYTLMTLPASARRRYGGYVVHFGITLMVLGFTGHSWNVDREASMSPGQVYQLDDYSLEYMGPRMDVDNVKRMVFADFRVTKGGKLVGYVNPAKFIYKKMPESPTTEVAMLHSLRDDLYVVVGAINPQTKLASLQFHINPLVSWIWIGCMVLIFGSIVCMWPELAAEESRVWAVARGVAGATGSITLGIILAVLPATAHAQTQTRGGGGASSLHAGTVHIENPREREVFSAVRCMCGGCARDLLSTCACGNAEDAREAIRAKLAAGETKDQIVLAYSKEYGLDSLAVPPNSGALRAIYVVPLVAITAGGIGVFALFRRWRSNAVGVPDAGSAKLAARPLDGAKRDEYDARLDEELRKLDD
ncbi:cytochrome c-type biogenesis CcmF C-terminal domain-containing protein [Pendulispora albinea]|uniref:Cytochrome c-type biogenesis protein n=1 Tax=Pendulispora albinea TaxID=2741071 RepID=A0ABZ2LUS8_9BACT